MMRRPDSDGYVRLTDYTCGATMRKVELIYLHALLAKTHEYLAVRHDLPETFDDYETGAIGPYQIQRRKEDHAEAARLLAERLADEVADEKREVEVPEA